MIVTSLIGVYRGGNLTAVVLLRRNFSKLIALEQFAVAHFETWYNPNKQIVPIKLLKKFPLVPELRSFS